MSVEFVLHQTRLDAAPELFLVHFQNILHVFGKIEDDGMTDRLTGQRSAAAARQDRYAELIGDLDGRLHVLFVPRHDDADGLDLIDRRVGGIEQPRVAVEANIALDALFQLRFDLEIIPAHFHAHRCPRNSNKFGRPHRVAPTLNF